MVNRSVRDHLCVQRFFPFVTTGALAYPGVTLRPYNPTLYIKSFMFRMYISIVFTNYVNRGISLSWSHRLYALYNQAGICNLIFTMRSFKMLKKRK